MKKHIAFLGLIVLFSFIGVRAIFAPGLFTAHDIWHQVARLYWFNQSLTQGFFPPYWITYLAKGFGYPLFMFSYQAPWMIGELFLIFKFDIQSTIKILFMGSYLFSGIFMYFATYEVTKNKISSLVSSIIYLWAPQRFLSIFVAAQMGVCFVYLFLPILFWGIIRSINNKLSAIILISLGTSGIILSHLSSFLSLVPLIMFLVIYTIWVSRGKNILTLLFGLLLGIGLTSYYLIPLLTYSHLTQISNGAFADLFKNNFVNLSQLIYSKWGYGIIDKSAKEGAISFQLGIVQWISFFGVIVWNIVNFIKKRKIDYLSIFLSLVFVICIFLMLSASQPIWEVIKNIIPIDYPFRFVLPATFIGSVLLGLLISKFNGKIQFILVIIFILISLYTNRNHTRINLPLNIPTQEYINSEITTTSYHEYSPLHANPSLLKTEKYSLLSDTKIPTKLLEQKNNMIKFEVNTNKNIEVTINHFAFPGINLYLNNIKADYIYSPDGRIITKVPSGENILEVKFENTPIINISIIFSTVTLGILIIIIIFQIVQSVKTWTKILP